MAKKEIDALAVVDQTTQALVAGEHYDPNDRSGKEEIDANDIKLPFLAIAQKMSPQIDENEAKYLEGVKVNDLFNSITGEVYPQPVEFIPLLLRKHAIQFVPFDDGGGVIDRDVPWNDPRCEFSKDDKPIATRFYDWAVLLGPDFTNLIVLSFKSSNIPVAKQFQGMINMLSGPTFSGKYRLKVGQGKGKKGSFGIFSIVPGGRPTPSQLDYAKNVYASIKNTTIEVEHTADEADSFDPNNM